MSKRWSGRTRLQAGLWLIACAAAGAAMAFLFDDSCQLDGGLHFLFARWSWTHHELFVGVWSRPLYTFLYSFPALVSYRAARLFTVVICLAIGWQTWRLAEDLKIERAPLAIALLWLQPSFFLFSADNMTEPVFALTFVIALRLHYRGWIKAGMFVASLLILARPEGFFMGVLWGIWVLIADCGLRRDSPQKSQKGQKAQSKNEEVPPVSFVPFGTFGVNLSAIRNLPLLAAGSFIWWLTAWLITGDPLFIKHNWPPNWPLTGTIYGAAGLYAFPIRLPEMVGGFLLPPFLYGLCYLLKRRELGTITSSFLLFFILHTILRAFGLLGSAGYPRYMVAVSPAIALITLTGWGEIARLFSHVPHKITAPCAGVIIATAAFANFVYADGAEWSRDARAIAGVHKWFRDHEQPALTVTRLIWSEPYSCILFDRDPWENASFTRSREDDINLLRQSTAGTLAVWDERVGPKWYGLRASDFEEAGFVRLHSQSFVLKGYILDRSWLGYGGPRHQVIYLLYKI